MCSNLFQIWDIISNFGINMILTHQIWENSDFHQEWLKFLIFGKIKTCIPQFGGKLPKIGYFIDENINMENLPRIFS